MKAMILVAGKGSRLGDLTREVPKPLLPVAGKPLLQHTIEMLRDIGITDIVLNPGYLGHEIFVHFSSGARYGVNIEYNFEDELLGTAGGVKAVQPLIQGMSTLVLYGDNYYRCDLKRLIRYHLYEEADWGHPACTLALQPVYPWDHPASSVDCDVEGRVTGFLEKPYEAAWGTTWKFAGAMMLNPSLLDTIPEGEFCDFGFDVFPQWVRLDKKLGTVLYDHDDITDIGTPEGYWKANELAGQRMD